jgi:four helix bundle protein
VPAVQIMERPWNLRRRTILFSVSVIRFCRTLPGNDESAEIAKQVRRASSSIGAHYAAASRNKSDKDYINKMSGGIEEGDEAMYWFDILGEADIAPKEIVRPLRDEAEELVRIFVASRRTAITRQQRKRALKQQQKKGDRPGK